jgi:peptidoglycan hydrolase CwlO-like protein
MNTIEDQLRQRIEELEILVNSLLQWQAERNEMIADLHERIAELETENKQLKGGLDELD